MSGYLNPGKKTETRTASVFYVEQFYRLASNNGLNADLLLEKAGISSGILGSAGARVDAKCLAELIKQIWEGLDDECMALADSRIPLGSFSMMSRLTVHEDTLESVIRLGFDFYEILTKAFSAELEVAGEKAVLKFFIQRPDKDKEHLFSELNLMVWHRYASWIISYPIPLIETCFPFSRPKQFREYKYLFPGQHVFNADFLGFSFHKKYLGYKNTQDKETLVAFVNHCPEELFIPPRSDFSLSGSVILLLKEKVSEGFPCIGEISKIMCMTERTLARRLEREGTSYQKLKDAVRRERAESLLAKAFCSVKDVASACGFSDAAVFARAFKSWTGFSPSEYRSKTQDDSIDY